MTIIYVTGAANTPMASDQLARVVRELHDASGPDPEVLLAHPTTTSTCSERLSFVTSCDMVVLVAGWERDQMARRDAQIAVWTEKPIRLDIGLREGKAARPVLREFDGEQVQAILDRGLQTAIEVPGRSQPQPDAGEPGGAA